MKTLTAVTCGLCLLAIPLALAACDDKKVDDNAAASASAPASAPAPVASAAPSASAAPVAAVDVIPSQADEAVKAEKEISKANYKQELDKLDKEISGK